MPMSLPPSFWASLSPSASTSTRARVQRQTLSAEDDDSRWPDLPAQFKEDVRNILFPREVREFLEQEERSRVNDALTLHGEDNDEEEEEEEEEDDDDMDSNDDDIDNGEFSQPGHLILPGAGVEGLTTSTSMESFIDDVNEQWTFDPMSAPSSSPLPTEAIPTREEIEEHNDWINFLHQTLAITCIVVESYLTAYHRAHPLVRFEDIVVHRPLPRYNGPTLIEYVLGGPVNLIPLSDFQNIYGIQFPDTSTRPPPMSESFTLTPLDWIPPPRPRQRATHYTRGSRPVEEALRQGPDWMRLVRLQLFLDAFLRESADTATTSNELVQTAPVSLDHLDGIRRVKRDIKPLPKRITGAVSDGQQQQSTSGAETVQPAGSLLGNALRSLGEAVVSGVKRLRDEFEETGFSGRRKKSRID